MNLNNKYIPINKVKTRMENLDIFLMKKDFSLEMYPLDETYNNIYDFSNIKSAIKNWNYFSESVVTNINKVCELLKVINKNGTEQDLQEAVDLINTNIIPYLKNPTEFKYNFNKLDKIIPEAVEQINNKIIEQAECDRVIYNNNLISKRFNLNKIFSHILEKNNFYETIYNFCDLIDTYDMPLKSKYCVVNELSLLYAKDYFDSLPVQLIEEAIIDYFLMYYGINDIPKCIEKLQDAVDKDIFISENAKEYLKYINKVYDNIDGTDYEKEVLNHFKENVGIAFVLNYTDYKDNLKKSYNNVLTEMKVFNRSKEYAKNLLTKLKISPVKTVGMVKDYLKSIFLNVSEQDVQHAINTLLEGTFFVLITLQTVTIGLIALIIGFVGDKIYEKYFSEKGKLRKAIETMKDHRDDIERQARVEVVFSKKERLNVYAESLDKEIEKLEEQYEDLIRQEKEEELRKKELERMSALEKKFPSSDTEQEE